METAAGPFIPWEAQGPAGFVKFLHSLSCLLKAGTLPSTKTHLWEMDEVGTEATVNNAENSCYE